MNQISKANQNYENNSTAVVSTSSFDVGDRVELIFFDDDNNNNDNVDDTTTPDSSKSRNLTAETTSPVEERMNQQKWLLQTLLNGQHAWIVPDDDNNKYSTTTNTDKNNDDLSNNNNSHTDQVQTEVESITSSLQKQATIQEVTQNRETEATNKKKNYSVLFDCMNPIVGMVVPITNLRKVVVPVVNDNIRVTNFVNVQNGSIYPYQHGLYIANLFHMIRWFVINRYKLPIVPVAIDNSSSTEKDENKKMQTENNNSNKTKNVVVDLTQLDNVRTIDPKTKTRCNEYVIRNWIRHDRTNNTTATDINASSKNPVTSGVYIDFFQFVYTNPMIAQQQQKHYKEWIVDALKDVRALKSWNRSFIKDVWFVGRCTKSGCMYVVPDCNYHFVYKLVSLQPIPLKPPEKQRGPNNNKNDTTNSTPPMELVSLNRIPVKLINVTVVPWYGCLICDNTSMTPPPHEPATQSFAIQLHSIVLQAIVQHHQQQISSSSSSSSKETSSRQQQQKQHYRIIESYTELDYKYLRQQQQQQQYGQKAAGTAATTAANAQSTTSTSDVSNDTGTSTSTSAGIQSDVATTSFNNTFGTALN